MKEKVQKFFEMFDLPGGSILGAWSLSYLLAFLVCMGVLIKTGRVVDIPAGWKEIFNWILTMFAASKTLKTIFGQPVKEDDKTN